MMGRYGIFSALLLFAFFSTILHGFSLGNGMTGSANAATASHERVANSITVTNASGGAISNYAYQFGRPFVDGTIANQPQVLSRCVELVESQRLLKSAWATRSAVQFRPKMGDLAQDRQERSATATDEDALRGRPSRADR
jgi:hypothetical protein